MPKATSSGAYHEAARDHAAEAEPAQEEQAEILADEEDRFDPEAAEEPSEPQEPGEPDEPEDYNSYPVRALADIGRGRGLVVSGSAGYLPKAELVALLENYDKEHEE